MNYGLQLYSVRDMTDTDLRGALCAVAEMGYTSVEFAGFFGHSAEEVKNMLAEAGLSISGAHTPCEDILPDRIDATIAYHTAIGNKRIIIPWVDLSTPEKLEALISLIREASPKLAAAGIALGYHNHHFEFETSSWGVCIHEELQKHTDIFFEIDTFWAWVAGRDPVALLKELGSRVSVIHLKDGLKDHTGKSLGLGDAPVAAVRAYALEHNLPMVVESETLEPNGIEEVARCISYLKSLEV